MPKHARDDGTCFRLEIPVPGLGRGRPNHPTATTHSTAPAAAPATTALVERRRARFRANARKSAHSSTDPFDARPPPLSPPPLPRGADRDAARHERGSHAFGVSSAETHRKTSQKRRPTKSALSLDVFSRAKRSTYDKRVVLEKRRNLAAAKVNKYRKTQNRLGDSVEVSDAFDPAKYAARLDAFDASSDLPRDDGFGRGRNGRRAETRETGDGHVSSFYREAIGLESRQKQGKGKKNRDAEDANAEDANAPRSDDPTANEGSEGSPEGFEGSKGGSRSNKGWNKAVKDGLKIRARREEKEKEMAALRVTWAAERAARDASRARRDATRDAFRKKNKRGQPVMRHRVDKILEQLQKDTKR